MVKPDIKEALRYLGISGTVPDDQLRAAKEIAAVLAGSMKPGYIYRVFDIIREDIADSTVIADKDAACSDETDRKSGMKKSTLAFRLAGTDIVLKGNTAGTMLSECSRAVLLACTLGIRFDSMLRREQLRDMSRAVILDACGSAYVEAGCDAAEEEIRQLFPDSFLTDRFSPGYGDLELGLQPAICGVLDAGRKLGMYVSESLLINPAKSVTAVIGISDIPQRARVRGCAYCSLKDTCTIRRGGSSCGL